MGMNNYGSRRTIDEFVYTNIYAMNDSIDTRIDDRNFYIKLILYCLSFLCASNTPLASASLHKAAHIDLSNNAVIDMHQDANGYMWIGTYDGLNLYNGKNTYVYRFEPENKNTLCSNIINKISDAGKDYLWISTSMGLNRFSLKERKVTESYTEYPECTLLATDSMGNTLLVNRPDHIACYSQQTGAFQDVNMPGLQQKEVKAVFADPNGSFYLLSADALLKKVTLDFATLPLAAETDEDQIHDKKIDIAFYEEGFVYFVDPEGDLFRYQQSSHRKEQLANVSDWLNKHGRITRITSFDAHVYVAFRNGLLLNLNAPEETLDLKIGIFGVYKDANQKILWIGTDGQGVRLYYDKQNRFGGLKLENFPIAMWNPIRSFYTDEDRNLWIGTKGDGFVRVEEYDSYGDGPIPADKVTRFSKENGLSSNRVYCFLQSKFRPLIWIGTEGPEFSYYSPKDKRVHTLVSKIGTPIRYVHSICEMNDSTLWMATTGDGLLKVTVGEEKGGMVIKEVEPFVFENDGKLYTEFYSMTYDGKSTLFLGSRGGLGMVRFHIATGQYEFLPMNVESNLAIGDVLCMCYSSDSVFYLGTSSGMTQLKLSDGKPTDVQLFDKTDGIINDMVHGILEDKDGCLWLSTNKGLAKYNPQNNFFHNYEGSDLLVTEFSDDAFWKCPHTNRLFFGGVDGLVWIDPQNGLSENYKPDLHFFELKMPSENLSLYEYTNQSARPVTIPSDISSFTVSFIAPDYIHGDNYEYSYKLEKYDASWTKLQKKNEISFTQLPYGDYVLKVRYKNDVFDSELQECFLRLNVLPPWYKSPWAITAYLLLGICLCTCLVYWLRRRIMSKQLDVARRIREEQKEKLYEAKLNFFANITHELCTPLTLINGVSNYMDAYSTGLSDPQLGKYARILKDNVGSLNELVQEILDFRRIEENGVMSIHSKQILITEVANRLLESFVPIAGQNKIHFTYSVPDQLFWNTDASCLKKIITNLVSNAFKYTTEGGLIRVSISADENRLRLNVYNTGKGISDADMHAVFDRFRVLGDLDGNDYARMTTRNGLGLYICHSLTQLLQGAIEVHSKEGEYAEFTVTLPSLEVAVAPIVEPDILPAIDKTIENTDKPVVLVVDDNRDIVWLIKEILSSKYTVRAAFCAEDALTLMKQQTPDLIITDIMMPGLDGHELIGRIKSDKFTRHIPLIVVSAKVSEREQAKGLDLGADVYLTKPFSSVVLLSAVNRLMTTKEELKDYYHSPESAYKQSAGQLIHREDKEFMDSVTAIIKENITHETLRPELIADKLGMNTRALYRRFKKISPLTPSDFIKDFRLTYAAQLLLTTTLSVQEIIYQIGVSNKSYFYREFSSKYRMTPWQYRQVK